MEKILQNPLDAWREGAQKWGENIVESMVDAVFANQEKGLSQLQELQKWNVFKVVQKLITTRFFPRENPFVPFNESPLLNSLECRIRERSEASGANIHNFSRENPIGSLKIKLDTAACIMLHAWKHMDSKAVRRLLWKAVVRTPQAEVESGIVLLSDPNGLISADQSLSSLNWPDEYLDLGLVNDSQCDIVIELHKKATKADQNVADLVPSMISEEKAGIVEMASLFGSRRGGGEARDEREVQFLKDGATPALKANTQSMPRKSVGEDVCRFDESDSKAQSSGKSSGEESWQLYAVVVIPIATILHTNTCQGAKGSICVNAAGNDEGTKKSAKKSTKKSTSMTIKGWFHLYPPNQQTGDRKYTRPCSGYPGLGMINPRISLGMIKLEVLLEIFNDGPFDHCRSILSNFNPPASVWRLASKLDLQVFENVGLRLHHVALSRPRWIHFFCHPSELHSFAKGQTHISMTQSGFLVCFWILLTHICVQAKFRNIPMEVGLLIILISLSYKNRLSDTLRSYAYIPLNQNCLPSGDGWGKEKPRPMPSTFFPNAMGIKSTRVKEISKWMEDNPLNIGTCRDSDFKQPWKHVLSQQVAAWLDGDPTSAKPCDPIVPSMIFPSTTSTASSVGSVFGRLEISVADGSSYVPVFPVFSDDVADLDLHNIRHLGMFVLEGVQIALSLLATSLEKLKFAFNWSDPSMAITSWIVVVLISVQLSLGLWALSFIPPVVIRFLFIFVPITVLLGLSDPKVAHRVGLDGILDASAYNLAQWQPESQFCLRIVIDIWDAMFRDGLLTPAERICRHRHLEDLVTGKKCGLREESGAGSLVESKSFCGYDGTKSPIGTQNTFSPRVELDPSTLCLTPRQHSGFIGVHSAAAILRVSHKGFVQFNDGSIWRRWRVRLRRWSGLIFQAVVLKPIRKELQFLYYWFLRLPDRREMEHRAICATQYLGPNLDPLIRAHLRLSTDQEESIVDLNKHISDTYRKLFKPRPGTAWSAPSLGKTAIPLIPTTDPVPANEVRAARKLLSKGFSLSQHSKEPDVSTGDAWYTAAGAKKNVESMLKRFNMEPKPGKPDSNADHSDCPQLVFTNSELPMDDIYRDIPLVMKKNRSISLDSVHQFTTPNGDSDSHRRRPDSSSPEKKRHQNH